jgi:hypothetical protein
MLPAAALLVASAAFLFPSHAMAQAVAIAEVDGYVVDPAGAGGCRRSGQDDRGR